MTPPGELDEDGAISELLGLAPEDFTGRRNELVKVFKVAGKRDQAARLALVRKPAVHVWAANHLARRRDLAVTRLLSTAADLSDAQEKAFAGGSGAGERLRRDSGAYQRALDLAVREAAGLLREAGRPSADETLRRLRDVLGGAALGGEDLRRRLGTGTILEEPPPPGAAAFSFAGPLPAARPGAAPRERVAKGDPAPAKRAVPAAALPSSRDKEQHRLLLQARKAAESTAEAASRLGQVARRARRRADAAAAEASSAGREAADAEARAATAAGDAESAAATLRALTERD